MSDTSAHEWLITPLIASGASTEDSLAIARAVADGDPAVRRIAREWARTDRWPRSPTLGGVTPAQIGGTFTPSATLQWLLALATDPRQAYPDLMSRLDILTPAQADLWAPKATDESAVLAAVAMSRPRPTHRSAAPTDHPRRMSDAVALDAPRGIAAGLVLLAGLNIAFDGSPIVSAVAVIFAILVVAQRARL